MICKCHYFDWQLSVYTSFRLVYRLIIARSTYQLLTTGSDKTHLPDKIITRLCFEYLQQWQMVEQQVTACSNNAPFIPKVKVKADEPRRLPIQNRRRFVRTFTFPVLSAPHSNSRTISEMDRYFITFIGPGCDVPRSLTSKLREDSGIKRF